MFQNQQHLLSMVYEMHGMLRWQSEKMAEMEKELVAIKERLKAIDAAAKTNVEKIEYHFEQLKVESLEGTLMIGIRPDDASKIEELWTNHKQDGEELQVNQAPDNVFKGICDDVYQYIRDSVPSVLDHQAEQKGVQLSEEAKQSIVEDMIRQSDERIAFYLQQMREQGMSDEATLRNHVIQKLKSDIHAAVGLYVEHFRKEGST